MATFYTNEVTVGSTLSGTATVGTSSIQTIVLYFSGGTTDSSARIAFNNPPTPLTSAAPLIATFANTAGTSVSSGTGSITYTRSLSSQPVFLIMPDRTSFAGTLPLSSSAMTLTNNGYEGWGPNEVRLRNLGYF